uniref:Putative ovule protein n=1 Tax=Solanum chacoense TaxID=4108 RepID=A0A0V0HM88_SOLCH
MPRSVEVLMFSWKSGARRRRHKDWNVTPLVFMWVVWRERNRGAFEGVETSFAHLRSTLRSLIFFWCTNEVPVCIKNWVSIGENHILYVSLLFFGYTSCIRPSWPCYC